MENFNLFNDEDDDSTPMERLFDAYIQQCMGLQLMYLDSWVENEKDGNRKRLNR